MPGHQAAPGGAPGTQLYPPNAPPQAGPARGRGRVANLVRVMVRERAVKANLPLSPRRAFFGWRPSLAGFGRLTGWVTELQSGAVPFRPHPEIAPAMGTQFNALIWRSQNSTFSAIISLSCPLLIWYSRGDSNYLSVKPSWARVCATVVESPSRFHRAGRVGH